MTTTTSYRSARPIGHDGFGQLLWAEWTKLRTVRGWVLALVLAAALTAAVPIFLASTATAYGSGHDIGPQTSCVRSTTCQVEGQDIATGPGGVAVIDNFYFAHQPLASDGSITARVSGLHGIGHVAIPPGFPSPPSTMPWARAGLIIKASTKPGAAYAAVMLTGGHGVQMQYDFTHDVAGASTSAPWLRLTRAGDKVTAYESDDGRHWTDIGTAVLPGLTGTAQVGLFVASPTFQAAVGSGDNSIGIGTDATASFGHIALSGAQAGGHWTGTQVGTPNASVDIKVAVNGHQARKLRVSQAGALQAAAGTVTVAGSGDIAPFEPIVDPLHVTFIGTLFGVIALITLGALFVTAEYRRGLIRTTVTASPRRGRILVAKSIVIGVAAFVAGLIGGAIALPVASHKLYANGWQPPAWPELSLTSGIGLRIVLGTAAIAAVASVLGLAAGAILRRGTGAILATAGVIIIPLILALVMPLRLATWLLRLFPAAAFSLQSSVQRYPQVSNVCAPYHSCFPLSPWHGFAVLCAWAAVALGVAIYALRRRDV